MTNRVEKKYFEWLISQINVQGTRTFFELFEMLFTIEFVWTVPHDDNRLQDGLDLRTEFLNRHPHISRRNVHWDKGATVLEVIIALSRRLAFTAGGTAEDWAWQLITNLRLNKMTDPLTENKVRKVHHILERLIWRQYREDGLGGFFPLNWPDKDQTQVEIWYQMQKYVTEIQQVS
jgi:hypothetical protein